MALPSHSDRMSPARRPVFWAGEPYRGCPAPTRHARVFVSQTGGLGLSEARARAYYAVSTDAAGESLGGPIASNTDAIRGAGGNP